MALDRSKLFVYLVTDPDLCREKGVVETVREAVTGGITMVQLRDKDATTAERIELARALMKALEGTSVPLIVNDDLDAAVASGADGAHIGQSDGLPQKARQMLGPEKMLGLSCETPARVEAANDMPVDYLGLGPVFATGTKSDHDRPVGIDGLKTLVDLSAFPTVAIGGLNASHVQSIVGTGCDGLAVVSAICGQVYPDVAAREFLNSRGE